MKIILACAALLTVSQGRAQTSGSFPVFPLAGRVPGGNAPARADDHRRASEILRDPVRQDPRVVLSALDQIGDWTRVMTPEQEARDLRLGRRRGLPSLFPQARAKALDALSRPRSGPAMNPPTAGPSRQSSGSRAPTIPRTHGETFRLPALLALARTAPSFPNSTAASPSASWAPPSASWTKATTARKIWRP